MDYPTCEKCKARCFWAGKHVTRPEHGKCFVGYKPITWADKIRKMTDMELAQLLTDVARKSAEKLCESLKTVDVDLSSCDFNALTKAHLEWLREEVQEDV